MSKKEKFLLKLYDVWQLIRDRTGFFECTDLDSKKQRGKTLWDWMQLLIIPIMLLTIGRWYSNVTRESDLAIADEQLQKQKLANYLNKMEDYMLNRGLREAKDQDDSSIVYMAQIQSIAALRSVDTKRQELILQFLYDVGLSDIFAGASMDNIDLSHLFLCAHIFRSEMQA